MTGLVRKATLFGVCGLFAATAAFAGIPDPTTSTVPAFLWAVGILGGSGNPDVDGANGPANNANVITIKDFSGSPVSGAQVHIKLPCDFNLCNTVVAGQTVNCPAGTLNGTTNPAGQWTFTIIAAAKDRGLVVPCAPPGCSFPGGALNSTIITVDGFAGTFKTATTAALDQNGSSGAAGTNGVTAGDATVVLNQQFAVSLGGPANYKGRADIDGNGANSAADAAAEIGHVGRIALLGGSTCTTTFCATKPACP
jgi:hypothetical protein